MPTRIQKTLNVCCPECLSNGVIRFDFNDMTLCECDACGVEFEPAEAVAKFAAHARRWEAVAAWIELAPVVEGE